MDKRQLPDAPGRFDLDLKCHLGFATFPVSKMDGHFYNLNTETMCQVSQFYQEDIPIRMNSIKRNLMNSIKRNFCKRCRMPEAVPRCNVPVWKSQ